LIVDTDRISSDCSVEIRAVPEVDNASQRVNMTR
jgi:hypothetical protein